MNNKNEKEFVMPAAEVIVFDAEDVITTSNPGGFEGPGDNLGAQGLEF